MIYHYQMAILGFEVGYSLSNPKAIVIWHSHKEDRTSLNQYVIDLFIAAGESRWLRQCGIVCLLPHGLDGEGEECSSARPERYLQMCSDDEFNPDFDMGTQLNKCNWIVANVTTPANYFHIIRRQAKLNYRKPLILFIPKYNLARIKESPLEDILDKTEFKPYIPDEERQSNPETVIKILLCTGGVFFDLYEYRKIHDQFKQIAICRLEQISPFPYQDLTTDVSNYKMASLHWVQEEHKNQGWWKYVSLRILNALKGTTKKCNYIGRSHSPFRATEDREVYLKEKETFLSEAMKLKF